MRHAILKSILFAAAIFSGSVLAGGGGPAASSGTPGVLVPPSGNPFTVPDLSGSIHPGALNPDCTPITIIIIEHIGGEKHFIYSTIRNPRC